MARVRQKQIKEAAKKILARYWPMIRDIWKESTRIEELDEKKAANYRFEMYKKLVDSILETDSKTMRNRVAGYLVTLCKQVIYLQRISISELRAKYGMREGGEKIEDEGLEGAGKEVEEEVGTEAPVEETELGEEEMEEEMEELEEVEEEE